MSAEILTGEDKDKLRKRLELLQKEYERTAQRLQRAERRDVVRKHVQKTISDQSRLSQTDTPAVLDQSSSSSSASSELLSNQTRPPGSTKVRFDLPHGSDASPLPSLRCRRSPSLRLRSRRSRLRLQVRAKESDTDESQEKTGEGAEGAARRDEVGRDGAEKRNLQGVDRVGGPDVGQAEEKKQLEGSSAGHSADPPVRSDEAQTAAPNPDLSSSCTLIEGLLFPAEYYIRTTRRMASARSPVDIDAVILSQLSRGRRRRRSPEPHVTPVQRRGQRGRRGRGRARDGSRTARSNPGPDFRRLSDSQLRLPDSEARPALPSGAQARGKNGAQNVPGLLPPLNSLDHVRTAFEVRDFHLPDDEFGRLKLERLRAATSTPEPLAHGAGGNPGTNWNTDPERFLPRSTTLESQLTSTDRPQPPSGGTRTPLRSQSRLILDLSMSSTSHTQVGPGASLISLGESPAPSDLGSCLISSKMGEPENQRGTSKVEESARPGSEVHPSGNTSETRDQSCSGDGSDPVLKNVPEEPIQSSPGVEHGPPGSEQEKVPDLDVSAFFTEDDPSHGVLTSPEKTLKDPDFSVPDPLEVEQNQGLCPEVPRGEGHAHLDAASRDDPAHRDGETLTLFEDPAHQTGDEGPGLTCSAEGTGTDATGAQIRLQRTHTLKALDGGCVLDVCVVRWSPADWCVCVAGEWSVCVWVRAARRWDLRHTWTFVQSVISLQEVPDTSGLLCVSLGRLEIMEARVLCCPRVDGPFSQAELCRDDLQAVLAVSDCRVTCCSSPGPQQVVQVFTLAQDGRAVETRPLASSRHSVRTLAAVEGEKDALLGWTERQILLVWNMKSGQLLQTVRLSGTAFTATCLRGYSYRGVLCVLLQRAVACDEDQGSALFTLMATNPLTGKHFTLTSVANPTSDTERLMDGDTCASALAGVFQSGHLAVWDLRGGASCVYSEKQAGMCRLVRWAGPDVLLTGYLNGDVSLYQYRPVETIKDQYKPVQNSTDHYKPV